MLNVFFYVFMSFAMHPLHLGVVHFNMNDSATADIVVRLFSDDLMNAIDTDNHGQRVFSHLDSALVQRGQKYISQHLKLKQGMKGVSYKFIHVKQVEDATEFRLKASLATVDDLQICCTFFFEIYGDQTNLLLVKSTVMEDGFRLTSRNTCAHVKV